MWGTYTLSVVWVGGILFSIHGSLVSSRGECFRREGRRLAQVWAERLAEAGSDLPRRSRLLRRFAGEMDTRAAVLLNEQGQPLETQGDPVSLPVLPSLSEPSDKSLSSDSWVFWAPLWVDGRRSGMLVWVRNSQILHADRSRDRSGLLAAWAWWAAVGAVGAVFFSREA